MKTIKIISYGLIFGLALGGAVPALQAGEHKITLKSKVKKVIRSRWFKLGVGVAALCTVGASLFFYRENLNAFCLGKERSEVGVSSAPEHSGNFSGIAPVSIDDRRECCDLGDGSDCRQFRGVRISGGVTHVGTQRHNFGSPRSFWATVLG